MNYKYNHELMKWRREFPETLWCNQKNFKSDNYDRCVMGLRYTYYLCCYASISHFFHLTEIIQTQCWFNQRPIHCDTEVFTRF